MGGSSSKNLDIVRKMYQSVGITGGSENCVIGGLVDIEKYLAPPLDNAKKNLIIDIAAEMSKSLFDKDLDPKGKTISEIIERIKKVVPDPRSGGKTFTSKSETQVKACKIIADILNSKYGDVIDPKRKPEEICEEVSELVYSLFTGIHQEFLTVKKDVERLLKNMKVVEQVLERTYNLMIEKISSDKESSLSSETASIQEVHKDAMTELHRQQKLLENMLNLSLKSSEGDLDVLLKENTDLKQLVKKIKQIPGTPKFGEKLAYVTAGIKTVAIAAKTIDEALKKVGLTYKEYHDIKDFKSLNDILSEKTVKMLNSPTKDLEAYEKAKANIYRYQYMHDDIVKELEAKTGKAEDDCNCTTGGDDTVTGGMKLDKRVKKRQELKRQLLKSFNQRLSSLINMVYQAAKKLGDRVGTGMMPLSDDMEKFAKALDELPDLQKKYIYLALSGFNEDIESKQERERFIGQSKFLISVLSNILKDKDYSDVSEFKDMKTGLEQIVELIEAFVSRFAEGFGPYELQKKKPESGEPKSGKSEIDVTGGLNDKDIDNVLQGVGETIKTIDKTAKHFGIDFSAIGEKAKKMIGSAEEILPEIARIGYALERTKDIIRYNFRTAKVRQNLHKMSGEMKSYGEDYTKILGDAIAGEIDDINGKKKTLVGEVTPGHPLSKFKAYLVTSRLSETDQKDKLDEVRTFLVKHYDAKIDSYRVAEAVDLYMKAFADGIASSPNDVKDLVRILSDTEIISQWFTEKSGEYLCKVFETFPGYVTYGPNPVPLYSGYNKVDDLLQGVHYYDKIASICNLGDFGKNNAENSTFYDTNFLNWTTKHKIDASKIGAAGPYRLPGNPYISVPYLSIDSSDENTGKYAMEYIKKSLEISALKNIISMFVNIGKKFGGKELEKQTHMSPIQIYKSLVNIMTYSSVRVDAPAPKQILTQLDLPNLLGKTNGTAINVNGQMVVGTVNDKTIPITMSSCLSSLLLTDKHDKNTNVNYTLCIKAIVAKILTTLGVYNMFNKPVNINGLGYKSNLRTILGGADDPKVIPEAIELYVRLPLLAEFYREVFKFDAESSQDITLVPEMDGTFSGLVNFIFDKAKHIKNGEYSATDVSILIAEINKIWSKFAGSKNPVNDTIQEFVAEINRRYGVVKKNERVKYLKERSERYTDKYKKPEDITDFEISGIDESDDYFRPAPSMSFQTVGSSSTSGKLHKHEINYSDKDNLESFRNSINVILDGAKSVLKNDDENQETLRSKISFVNMIEARKEELTHAKTDKEKLDIVHNSIISLGQFALTALEKSLILFHESVVYPLNNLAATYMALSKFEEKISGLDKTVQRLEEFSKISPPVRFIKANNVDFGDYNKHLMPYAHGYLDLTAIVPENTGVCNHGFNGFSGIIPVGNPITKFTYKNLDDSIQAGAGHKDEIVQYIQRFLLDQDKMLLTLLESVFTHSSSFEELIDLKIDVQKMVGNNEKDGFQPGDACDITCYINHSKLFKVITDTFNTCKQNLEKFRGLIPKNILKKYEEYDIGKNNGSVYWVEKNLINELINGRRPGQIDNSPFDSINQKMQNILKFLTKSYTVNAGTFFNGTNAVYKAGLAVVDIHNGSYKESKKGSERHNRFSLFTKVTTVDLFGMLDGAFNAPAGPVNPLALPGDITGLKIDNILSLLYNTSKKTKGVAPNKPYMAGILTQFGTSISEVHPLIDETNSFRSVMTLFNKLVYEYVVQAYDYNTKKIYASTIDEFANGSFSSAVMGDNNFDDEKLHSVNDVLSGIGLGWKGVLNKSMAIILRNLVTELTDKGDRKSYYETNINEIPLFVKERYRANFPVFQTMFEMLLRKCEVLKQFIKAFNIDQPLTYEILHPATENKSVKSRMENEKYFNSVLEQIVNGCTSIIKCIKTTLAEVAGDSKYLETYNGFIAGYENEHGMTPFMPISSIGYILKNSYLKGEDKYAFAPINQVGDNGFKLLYGVRKIMHSPTFSLNDAPGMKDIIKGHNQSVDGIHSLDEKSLESFFGDNIRLSRGLMSLKHYAPLLNYVYLLHQSLPVNANMILSTCCIDPVESGVISQTTAIYQLKNEIGRSVNLIDVIELTESSAQKDQKSKVISSIELEEGCPYKRNRSAMLAFNIIDMNIVPVNVHALMREIPLINLYNYALTFDSFISEIFKVTKRDTVFQDALLGGPGDKPPKNPAEKLLGYFLLNPYVEIDAVVYESFVSAIMRGSLGLQDLGRPKYIGDEVFNKALFGEIYPGTVFFEEGGPNVGMGHLRGKLEVLTDTTVFSLNNDRSNNLSYTSFAINIFVKTILELYSGKSNIGSNPGFDQNILGNMLDYTLTITANRTMSNDLLYKTMEMFKISPIDLAAYKKWLMENDNLNKIIIPSYKAVLKNIDDVETLQNKINSDTRQFDALGITINQYETHLQRLISDEQSAGKTVKKRNNKVKTEEDLLKSLEDGVKKIEDKIVDLQLDLKKLIEEKDPEDDPNWADNNANARNDITGKIIDLTDNDLANAKKSVTAKQNDLKLATNSYNTNNDYYKSLNNDLIKSKSYSDGLKKTLQALIDGIKTDKAKLAGMTAEFAAISKVLLDSGATVSPIVLTMCSDARNVINKVSQTGINPRPNVGPVKSGEFERVVLVAGMFQILMKNAAFNSYIRDEFDNIKKIVGKNNESLKSKLKYYSCTVPLVINKLFTAMSNNSPIPLANIHPINIGSYTNGRILDITSLLNTYGWFKGGASLSTVGLVNFTGDDFKDNNRADVLVDIISNSYQGLSGESLDFEKDLSINQQTKLKKDHPEYFPPAIHYMADNDIKTVHLLPEARSYLHEYGKLRFDTTLIRDLFWITNIQRFLRWKLRKDLDWFDGKVVKDLPVASSNITELFGNNLKSKH